MYTSKIKFTAISIGWSMGGVIDMHIKASAGSKISIAWGDGRVISHSFHNEHEMDFRHDYFPKLNKYPPWGIKFDVTIRGNSPDCRIIGFKLSGEADAIDLDVTNCPELEELYYEGYVGGDERRLDLSCNTALKKLYCPGNKLTSLDLSSNTALEHLYCNSNCLSHLNLSKNIALKKLHCQFNEMEKIFIYYAPQLCCAEFEEGNNIDDDTRSRIQEIIEENNIENE